MRETIKILLGTDERIQNYVKRQLKISNEGWDYFYIDWNYIVEKNALDSLRIVAYLYGEQVHAISPIDDYKEIQFERQFQISEYVHFDMNSKRDLRMFVEFFKENLPHVLLNWDEYDSCFTELGYVKMDNQFTHGRYLFPYLDPYVLIENQETLKNAYDDYHQKGEILSITTKVFNQREFSNYLFQNETYKMTMYEKENNFTALFGFTYLDQRELNKPEKDNETFICIIATEKKDSKIIEKCIGVIKVFQSQQFKLLCYIDVHFYYRKIGIAKQLYHDLNEYLKSNDILVSTTLSRKGREANLKQVRSNIINNCMIFESFEEYFEYLVPT